GIFVFSFVGGTRGTEPALIMSFVDSVVALGGLGPGGASPKFTHALVVKRLSSAHEYIVAAMILIKPKLGGHLLEVTDHIVCLFLRCPSVALGSSFDVDTVFVGSG